MARGTTLANLLLMLQGELGYNTTATVDNTILTQLINDKALWFTSAYDWPFLRTRLDVALVAGQRFYPLPALVYERPHTVRAKWNTVWRDIGDGYGVEEMDYNYEDSTKVPPQAIDPVQKWLFISAAEAAILNGQGLIPVYDATVNYFEVWPVPAGVQTMRFIGQTAITALAAGGDKLLLDDLLIVKSVAGDCLVKRESPDAQLKLQEAQMRFTQLQSAGPKKSPVFIVGKSNMPIPGNRRRRVLVG